MTRWRSQVVVALLALGAVSCGDDQETTRVTSTTTPTTSAPTTTPVSTPTTSPPTSVEVEAEGVLLAAVLLIVGDIEAAVAAGLVDPAEVDAAAEALETAKMAPWVTAATQALGG